MHRNQQYAAFRPELTAEQRERLIGAENRTEAYGRIAIEEANRQLAASSGEFALPDEPDVCLRYPGVDPKGMYSSIDLKIAWRTQRLDAAMNLREKDVRELVRGVLGLPSVMELLKNLKHLAMRHRVFTRAEKLCHDEAAVDSLHIQVRKLEVDPVVAEVDIVMQGLEYLLGIREGNPPEEVERFYRERLGVEFTQEQRDAGRRIAQPEEVNAYFADFDNVLLQALFSMPENWGLAIEDLEELRDEE